MDNLQRIERALNLVALSILIFLFFLICVDIHSFYEDKDKYAQIYRSSINEQIWEWEYLNFHVYVGLFALVGFILISIRLIKTESRIILAVNRTFLIVFFAGIIIGFFRWMASGYDH